MTTEVLSRLARNGTATQIIQEAMLNADLITLQQMIEFLLRERDLLKLKLNALREENEWLHTR